MEKLSSNLELMLYLKITNLDLGEYREVFCAPELNGRNECTIGRSKGCALILDGDEVSRVHAKIVFESEAYWLIDANSKTGCCLNDQKINLYQFYKLSPSDSIVIGNFFILVHQVELS